MDKLIKLLVSAYRYSIVCPLKWTHYYVKSLTPSLSAEFGEIARFGSFSRRLLGIYNCLNVNNCLQEVNGSTALALNTVHLKSLA